MRTCMKCEREEAIVGLECPQCSAVSIVFTMIAKDWRKAELAEFEERLREKSLRDFTEWAKDNGASLLLRIGQMIRRLSFAAKMTPDELKFRVCDQITAYLREMEEIDKYEAKMGKPGIYREHCKKEVNEAMTKAFAKK